MANRRTTDGIGAANATAAPAARPTAVQLGVRLDRTLRTLCTMALPQEAVALLLGAQHGARVCVSRLMPLTNVAAAADAFVCQPWDFARAAAAAPAHGDAVLGFLHSHPTGPPQPSAADRAQLWRGYVQVIVGRRNGIWQPRAFFATERGAFVPLRWIDAEVRA